MKHPIRRRLMYGAFLALWTLGRWLPLRLAQRLGWLLGLLAYGCLRRERILSLTHLRHAFGSGLSDPIRHRIARRVFTNLGKTAMEWCVVDRYSSQQLLRLVDVQGLHHVRQGLAQGRGIIALSAHLGNWELLAMTVAGLGFQGGGLARRLRYPEYEPLFWSMRRRKGVETYARGSVKDVIRALRANRIVGMMLDQDVDSLEGIFVDFFGHPTYTPVGPAGMALMSGSPIVPCFFVRTSRRFRLIIEEPIAVVRSGDRANDLRQITQAWSRVVETYIRCYPDQWVWMHRRWKTQPGTVTAAREALAERAADGTLAQPPRRDPTRAGVPKPRPAFSIAMMMGSWLVAASLAGCGKPPSASVKAGGSASPATSAASGDPTQHMDRFTVVGHDANGAKRWELTGSGAVADGPVVTIQRPDGIGYSPERTAYLTASIARMHQSTRRVRLEHNVTIHTSEGLWLVSPSLYWLPDTQEMTTEQPVSIETDNMFVRGRGAIGNSELKHATLLRDVEMVLSPSEDEAPNGNSHVTITCDGPLVFDHQRNIATFHDHVHVRDNQGDLYSDTLVTYLNRATHTITYAEALGRVRIVQGPQTATGKRAVYEPAKGTVTLLGAPSLIVYPDEQTASSQSLPAASAQAPPASALP